MTNFGLWIFASTLSAGAVVLAGIQNAETAALAGTGAPGVPAIENAVHRTYAESDVPDRWRELAAGFGIRPITVDEEPDHG